MLDRRRSPNATKAWARLVSAAILVLGRHGCRSRCSTTYTRNATRPAERSTYEPSNFECSTDVRNCSASAFLANVLDRLAPSGVRYRARYFLSASLVMLATSFLLLYSKPLPSSAGLQGPNSRLQLGQ